MARHALFPKRHALLVINVRMLESHHAAAVIKHLKRAIRSKIGAVPCHFSKGVLQCLSHQRPPGNLDKAAALAQVVDGGQCLAQPSWHLALWQSACNLERSAKLYKLPISNRWRKRIMADFKRLCDFSLARIAAAKPDWAPYLGKTFDHNHLFWQGQRNTQVTNLREAPLAFGYPCHLDRSAQQCHFDAERRGRDQRLAA